MKTFKPTWLGRLILIPSIFLSVSGCTSQPLSNEVIIGTYEKVVVHSDCGDKVVMVKIDSGARTNSIHIPLADKLCLQETGDVQTVKSASGITDRPVVNITYTLAGKKISSTANVADRSELTYKMLVGVRDLDGRFLIRPERMRDEEEAEEN